MRYDVLESLLSRIISVLASQRSPILPSLERSIKLNLCGICRRAVTKRIGNTNISHYSPLTFSILSRNS